MNLEKFKFKTAMGVVCSTILSTALYICLITVWVKGQVHITLQPLQSSLAV